MATPSDFEGSNLRLAKPRNMTDEQCSSLYVFVDRHQSISCWKLSPDELTEILRTGHIWLSVMQHPQPPVLLSAHALVNIDGQPSRPIRGDIT